MNDQLIKSSGVDAVEISITQEAVVLRDDLLQLSEKITTVNDAFSKETALSVKKKLATHHKSIEATRKEIKAPVLELGKAIDKAAKDHLENVTKEGKRVAILLGAFETQERDRLAKIEEERKQKLKEEEDKIRKEEEAKAAEAKAKADEALKASKSEEESERIKAVAAALVKQDEEDAKERLKDAKKENAPVVKKGNNVRLIKTFHYEVENIKALYTFHPELCTIVPNDRAIKARMKEHGIKLPGLKAWTEEKGS